MKPFRSIIDQVEQWRRSPHATDGARKRLANSLRFTTDQVQKGQHLIQRHLQPAQLLAFIQRTHPLSRKRRPSDRLQSSIVFVVAVVSLTSVIGYRFYNEPQLAVGTIAPQTLRAPAPAQVIDTKTTEESRKEARTAAIPVLMLDQSTNQDVYQALQRLLDQGEEMRQQTGPFPFVEPSVLSSSTQRYLRQASEADWQDTIATVVGTGLRSPAPNRSNAPSNPSQRDLSESSQELAIIELQTYRRTYSAEDFSALKEVIGRVRQRYSKAVIALQSGSVNERKAFYDQTLFDLSDAEWLQLRSTVRRAVERILSQGVAPGLPDTLLGNAIQMQLETSPNKSITPLARRILTTVIRPNLVPDPVQTKLRAEQAAQAVANVEVEIRQGEVIVQMGKPITQSNFVLLDYFGLSRRRINWLGIIGFGGLVSTAVVLFLLVEKRAHPGLRRRDRLLVLLLTLSTPLLIKLIPASNLPAVGLLIGSFYGSTLGGTVVGLLSLLVPMGIEVTGPSFVASAVGSLVGAIMAGRLRSREELALLGGAVGLIQGIVYLILTIILSSATMPIWYIALTTAALQSVMGIAWSVVALGISPYLEQVFDLTTPIRLAELSNPNRPLLQKLASTTPGTFQHTLFVATLAEAAARVLNCNIELVRAGTLYHDIGKMHDPLGFIENQMGGPNKHDAIDDPWVSAAIIKKHVSEGLVMARKCRLPQAVQRFIPEHQGSMLISYFYYQAVQRAQEDPSIIINEADFRYDGPIPQSRETGIVMLADSCEAALRSLKEASPEEALAMVNRILRTRWQENQLIDSGLTRADMTHIADVFVQVWLQFNHQRIPYPKAAFSPRV